MIWYPYEQMKTMREPYKILDAEGVYLYTKDQKLIDSVSSWWCMIHGYKHPELTAAIKEQADHFCHVMLGGLTHEPVQKLSDKLQEYLPGDLDYCFFSDSGSVAVEVSLKMALQYNTNQGRKRPLVLALEHAYHGDTFKAMEVGDDEDYHFAFEEKTGVVHIPTEIAALEEAFEKYHDELNCFIVEPLLQGAGGMRMYDISFLKRARELCDAYDVLLIFDEVATGFGRTGSRFVADLVLPDILVLGKALTGGYIGHAVTVANHKVFDAFYSDNDRHALMHGPTFMGNARKFKQMCRQIIRDFDNLDRVDVKKPRVGVVGEILVKFHPAANNDLVGLLESEGAEAVVPDLTDFLLYCFYNTGFKADNLGFSKKSKRIGRLGINFFEWLRSAARDEFEKSKHFDPPAHIDDLANYARDIVSEGNQTGEGWFLTGEMMELIHSGTPNIVCTQPFACLPNHVVGKGVIKELRHRFPESNIVAIDYDPGASEVNQLNRIKLMLSTANKNLANQSL